MLLLCLSVLSGTAGAQTEPPEPGSDYDSPLEAEDEWGPRFDRWEDDWKIATAALQIDRTNAEKLFRELHEQAVEEDAPVVAGQLDLLGRYFALADLLGSDDLAPAGIFSTPPAEALANEEHNLTVVASAEQDGELSWQARDLSGEEIRSYLTEHSSLLAEATRELREAPEEFGNLARLLELMTAVPGHPPLEVRPESGKGSGESASAGENPYWGWTTHVFQPLREPALLLAARAAEAAAGDGSFAEYEQSEIEALEGFAERARNKAGISQ